MRHEWKTVWITGGSSGIGLELARLLDGDVPHVAISARSEDKLKRAQASGTTIAAYPLDVTDANAVAACVGKVEAAAGPIDLAVLNAGVWQLMSVEAFDLKTVRTAIEVNYMGVMNALDALLPRMLERGRGHIAIVASAAGYRGFPRWLAYAPAKAALINAAETLRSELAPRGITVSLVTPGFVDTPMTKGATISMPGIIPAEEAARKLLEGLENDGFEIIFPRGFVYLMKSLRRMPNALFFRVVRRFVMKDEP